MTEVQEYLLKLIKEIDDICLEHDIDYYIFAGSQLGVERNEGFLPWDDDIDLIMTEENYQKFMKVMREDPPPNRAFECSEQNKEYPLQFGKYMSTDMTGLIRPHAFNNAASGLWIDIIHAVPAPTSERRLEFIKKWFCCWCELDNEIYVEHKTHYEGFYPRYRFLVFLAKVFGKKTIDKWADKLFNSYPEDKCTHYLMYHSLYTDYRFFEKKFFEKPVRRLYEGMEVSVSPYNREFSRLLFGDSWMMVPPAADREVHAMVVDFDVPYYKYVDDYMCFLNKDEVMANLKETKVIQTKNLVERRKFIKRLFYIKGILLNERMKNRIEGEGIDLDKELEAGNFDLINDIYKEFEELQYDELAAKWGAFIPIEDDLLYTYINKAMRYDGQYYKANKFLRLRAAEKKAPLSAELESMKPVIDICRKLSIALWDDRDFDRMEEIINTEIEGKNYGFCIDFELAKLYLKMHKAEGEDDYDAVKTEIEKILKLIPDQGECIKLLGDIAYLKGSLKEAAGYYEKAENITTNGLLLLDIRKKKEEITIENS